LNIRNTPNGRLIMLTIVTTILVSANAFMASPHVYGRAWFMFAFLAVSPALISKKVGGREPIPRGHRRSR
ncbi:MAG TPA: hypothetical protein VN110_00700, partial [Sphingobium sp.]|nr:hypothetical protein [Sphingobium sp.]